MRYKTNLGKWKTLKEVESEEEKSLTSAVVKGKLESSPIALAKGFAEFFTNKLETMKNEMPSNNIVAEEVFKTLVPRVDEELTIKEVTIKDIKEIIRKTA